MNFKRISSILMCAAVILSMTACSDKKDKVDPSEVSPDFPTSVNGVNVSAMPSYIGSMSPEITQTLIDLGLSGRLVGISKYDKPLYDDEDEQYGGYQPANFGTVQLPDLIEIRRARPNIILTQAPFIEEDLIKLQQMSIEVIVIPSATDTASILKNCNDIFRIFHGEAEGTARYFEFETNFNRKLDFLKETISSAGEGKSAIYMRDYPLMMATGDTLESTFLEMLSFTNAAQDFSNWEYSKDDLVNLNPDVIFYSNTISKDIIVESANYKTVPAVKNDEMYEIDPVIFERRTPYIVDYLTKIARDLYPEAFPINEETEY